MMAKKKRTFTLIEIVMSMALFGFVILAAFSFQLATGAFMEGTNRDVEVAIELERIVDHISRRVALGSGDPGDAGDPGLEVQGGGTILLIRRGEDTVAPGDYTTNVWMRYIYEPGNNRLVFCDDWNGACVGSAENLPPDGAPADPAAFGIILSPEGNSFQFTTAGLEENRVAIFNLTLRYDATDPNPWTPQTANKNPRVSIPVHPTTGARQFTFSPASSHSSN